MSECAASCAWDFQNLKGAEAMARGKRKSGGDAGGAAKAAKQEVRHVLNITEWCLDFI